MYDDIGNNRNTLELDKSNQEKGESNSSPLNFAPELDSLLNWWAKAEEINDTTNSENEEKDSPESKKWWNDVLTTNEEGDRIRHVPENGEVKPFLTNTTWWPEVPIPISPNLSKGVYDSLAETNKYESDISQVNSQLSSLSDSASSLHDIRVNISLSSSDTLASMNPPIEDGLFILLNKLWFNDLKAEFEDLDSQRDSGEISYEDFYDSLVDIASRAIDKNKNIQGEKIEEKKDLEGKLSNATANQENKVKEYKENLKDATEKAKEANRIIQNSIASCLTTSDFNWIISEILKAPNIYSQIDLWKYNRDIFSSNFDLATLTFWENDDHVNMQSRKVAFLAFINYIFSGNPDEPMKNLDNVISWIDKSYSRTSALIADLQQKYPSVFLSNGLLDKNKILNNIKSSHK